MRKILLAAAALLLLPAAANAAAITVFATGMVGTGVRVLAASWSQETGNTVIFVGGSVPTVANAVKSGQPGDVVILPSNELSGLARVKAGAAIGIGRVPFGLGVAAGAPKPDISTEAGLQAALKSARMVSYNQPALSMAGVAVQKLLTRPGYEGVKTLLVNGGSAGAVARGEADMTLGVVTEELSTRGVEMAGELPTVLDLHIDVGGAILADSPEPAAAASFLAYVVRREAGAAWKAGGVTTPIP